MNEYLDLFGTFAKVGVMTFAGIQVCVCVLIFNAVLKLLKKSVVDKRTAAIFLIVMAGSLFLHISPVWFVVVSAVVGILLKNLEGRAAK